MRPRYFEGIPFKPQELHCIWYQVFFEPPVIQQRQPAAWQRSKRKAAAVWTNEDMLLSVHQEKRLKQKALSFVTYEPCVSYEEPLLATMLQTRELSRDSASAHWTCEMSFAASSSRAAAFQRPAQTQSPVAASARIWILVLSNCLTHSSACSVCQAHVIRSGRS